LNQAAMSIFSLQAALFRALPVALLSYALVLPNQTAKVDYRQKIEPIFKARCSPCHVGGQSSGGLSLDSYENLIKGGGSGPMVVPGKPGESELLNRILGKGGMPRMPMGFKPLTAEDTKLITDWIAEGAKNSSGQGTKHWAYVAPVKPALPKPKDKAWARNPIDLFVLSRLDRESLKPSPEADRTTLLRRVTLDLTGLPPTPAEVDSFLADNSKDAYEKVVDRLLASPHYGERMALPWLDAARYADSNGFQQDGDTHQYLWRDWVVNAFNADMPYDEFTIEQLAGDLLPNPTLDQQIATAFNRNHMLNGEGGAIAEEQRNVALFDRVDATATTWLGLTMACARCHDHKYDPITQRDYYSLMAYFNNVPETGVPAGDGQYRFADPVVIAGTPDQLKKLAAERAILDQATKEWNEYLHSAEFSEPYLKWKADMKERFHEARDAKITISPWSEVGTFAGDTPKVASEKDYGPEKELPAEGRPHPEWVDGKVNELQGENTTFYLSRVIESDRKASLLLSLGSDDSMQLWVNGAKGISTSGARAATPDSNFFAIGLKPGRNTILFKIMNGGGIGGFYFKSFFGLLNEDLSARLDSADPKDDLILRERFSHDASLPGIRLYGKKLSDERKQYDFVEKAMPRVMVMSDAMPRQTHIYNRGSYTEPLDEVTPSAPAMLPGKGGPNRLALARWITSPENPLASRVEVNRIWQTFFGLGLVKTPENFGVQGEPPVNPELLDWLAVDFRESGWKIKRLVRMIVTSSTYRQSSKVSKDLQLRDPENRLLARGPRFRMSSLILRDVALASSGLLNPAMGGKPVYPYQPKDIWDGLSITKERDFAYPQSKGADNYRRSLYTFWRRTVAPGNMFDASSRQVCTVRASLTSTPLHALTMLNDITWVEAGRVLAQNVMALPTPNERLTEAFRRVCARRPAPDELQLLNRALARSIQEFKANPDSAKAYITQGDSPPDATKDPVELAAYASVCLAIYNLDEAMTKE
jgi:mono/diheme cytochrome c family protein